jgi:hypothetical protein
MGRRTAIIIAAALVAAKGALTAVALIAWVAIPERRRPFEHWHVEFGPLAEWLAAGAAAGAAMVALWIAGRDRQLRIRERRDEEKTHARLVQLSVQTESNRPAVIIQARNFGPLPVIGVTLVDATWSEHSDARWITLPSNWVARNRVATSVHRPILKPSQGLDDTFDTLADFVISFVHPTEERPLAPIEPRTAGYQHPSYVRTDVSNVIAKVQFTTAHGVRWETPTKGAGSGEPARIS